MKLLASSILMGFGLMSLVSAIVATFSLWFLRLPRMLDDPAGQPGFDWFYLAGLIASLACDILSLAVFIVGAILFTKAWRTTPDHTASLG